MKFLKHCGVMIALLLALSFLLVGCDRGGVTEGTSDQTKEEILEESFPEEIVFVSNGDGTCYVDGFVSPDRLQTVELEIPEKSPAGDTVTEIRQLGDNGVLIPYILTPEDYEVMRQKVLAYYGGDEGNFYYQKVISYWGLKGLEFCSSDRIKNDLLATYPITAITNIYVFDPACPSAELASFDQLMTEAYPEYTHARRLRDLEKLIARAESEGLQEHGLSGYLELYQSKKIGAASFKSIILPDTVTKINDRAFEGCVNLESIHMPDHLTSIGEYSFSECTKLTAIELPNSVTSIGRYAFSGCANFETLELPDSVTSIEANTFEGCIGLETVKIPESITNIAEWAFAGCENLAEIELPDGLTRIERYAFSGCASLANVELPDGITYFGYAVFEKCGSLSSVKIPDGVTEVSGGLFRECGKLQTVILPETLKSIDYVAFENCHSLTNLTIPDSVTYIGSSAFTGCDSLYSRVAHDDYALYYVDRWVVAADIDDMGCLDVIPEDGTRGICSAAFSGANIDRVILPDSVRIIGDRAFENCSYLSEIVIPEGVVSIGWRAFVKCLSLSEVVFPKSIKELNCEAFSDNTRICYVGTREEWEAIEFSDEHALEDLWVVYNYVPES